MCYSQLLVLGSVLVEFAYLSVLSWMYIYNGNVLQ